MPHTTPSISRKYRSHDLNKSAMTRETSTIYLKTKLRKINKKAIARIEQKWQQNNDKIAHTLHREANVGHCTSPLSLLFLWQRGKG